MLHDFFNEDPFPVEPQAIKALKYLPTLENQQPKSK